MSTTSAIPEQRWFCSRHGQGLGSHCTLCAEEESKRAANPPPYIVYTDIQPTLDRIASALERIAVTLEEMDFRQAQGR